MGQAPSAPVPPAVSAPPQSQHGKCLPEDPCDEHSHSGEHRLHALGRLTVPEMFAGLRQLYAAEAVHLATAPLADAKLTDTSDIVAEYLGATAAAAPLKPYDYRVLGHGTEISARDNFGMMPDGFQLLVLRGQLQVTHPQLRVQLKDGDAPLVPRAQLDFVGTPLSSDDLIGRRLTFGNVIEFDVTEEAADVPSTIDQMTQHLATSHNALELALSVHIIREAVLNETIGKVPENFRALFDQEPELVLVGVSNSRQTVVVIALASNSTFWLERNFEGATQSRSLGAHISRATTATTTTTGSTESSAACPSSVPSSATTLRDARSFNRILP